MTIPESEKFYRQSMYKIALRAYATQMVNLIYQTRIYSKLMELDAEETKKMANEAVDRIANALDSDLVRMAQEDIDLSNVSLKDLGF